MARKIMFGRYIQADSFIHRLDPRVKLAAAVFMMVVSLLSRQFWQIALVTLATGVFVYLAKVSLSDVLKSIRPILFLLIFAFLLNVFTGEGEPLVSFLGLTLTLDGLLTGIKTLFRLSLLVLNTTLFMTLTTTPILIADAMERVMSPLKRVKFPVHEMAMMMSIALRFVPTLLDEAQKIMKAQSARGADYDTGGPIKKAKGLVSILIPLFISAFRRADDLATAMEARCYSGGEGRTRFRVMKIQTSDVLFSIIVALVGIVVFVGPSFLKMAY
ncbi:MAG TPA: energy-coupling factor transporter transmembrane protein EcfT [Fastidiosipila sp.]|nr:energy-coupling factor transporter transmembrane protein EcfT [Fastidiosipila sp.]